MQVGRKQWRNAYNKCIDFKDGNFKQQKCAILSSTDKASKQQYVLLKDTPAPPPPPPPAAKDIRCDNWLNKYTCPQGKVPISSPSQMFCKGAIDYSCNPVRPRFLT